MEGKSIGPLGGAVHKLSFGRVLGGEGHGIIIFQTFLRLNISHLMFDESGGDDSLSELSQNCVLGNCASSSIEKQLEEQHPQAEG